MKRLERRNPAGLMALLVGTATALVLAPLVAQENAPLPVPRPVPTVRQLANGRVLVRHNVGWMLPPEWLTIEPVTDGDERVRAPEVETRWRGYISDEGFDRSLFGGAAHSAAAREQFVAMLQHEVDDLSDKYGLTAAQKQKLLLSGRGDIKRLFDRIEAARRRLQAHVIDDAPGILELSREWSRELDPLRSSIKTGPLGEGSLFAKTLRGALTAEQIAAYEKWKRDHPVVVTYSWDLRIR